MYTLFISKISKLLDLNPWELQSEYEDAVFRREFNIRLPKEHTFFRQDIQLPGLKHEPKPIRNPIMRKKMVECQDRCTFGIENENSVISHLIDRNGWNITSWQKLVRYKIPGTEQWQLSGKIDGIREYPRGGDRLLEVKCRINGFSGIRENELIQVQLYLLATGLKSCLFVECYRNSVKAHTIQRNEDYIGILVEAIRQLTHHIDLARDRLCQRNTGLFVDRTQNLIQDRILPTAPHLV
jgi:hypothetical protein